ncbi:MAG TPA: 2-oxoacid:ferredoxin oxidoreductase subunit beta [Nanoarchaeota archaeon]|nr:2-oxoacid:ferredoxin oxidoreductase subunit beta [Nanoarchaeota archaeon]
MNDLIKQEMMPAIWCQGCPLGIILAQFANVLAELGLSKDNAVIVSGIGCTGRFAGYMNMDSVHTTHGRAIPVAEGIKTANPALNVIVVSGDGDLLGIGGNHMLHSSRRDIDITVICINNELYGLTGGQLAPTSQIGAVTLTSPQGSAVEPINIQGLSTLNKKHFYARTTPAHVQHMKKCMSEAISWKGFSFVEIRTKCITRSKSPLFKTGCDLLNWLKTEYKITDENRKLKDNEMGIIKSG